MTRPTAVLICPGRGTYTKTELGTLARTFTDKALLADFDTRRRLAVEAAQLMEAHQINALLVTSGGQFAGEQFAWLLLLNPADVFRILNVFSLDDVRTLYGLASVVPQSLGNPLTMGAVMLLWIVLPLALAHWRFKP